MRRVLLLNVTYEPLTTVGLKRAVCLVLCEKAEIVHHDTGGQLLHSATVALATPSVIRLRRYVRILGRERHLQELRVVLVGVDAHKRIGDRLHAPRIGSRLDDDRAKLRKRDVIPKLRRFRPPSARCRVGCPSSCLLLCPRTTPSAPGASCLRAAVGPGPRVITEAATPKTKASICAIEIKYCFA